MARKRGGSKARVLGKSSVGARRKMPKISAGRVKKQYPVTNQLTGFKMPITTKKLKTVSI